MKKTVLSALVITMLTSSTAFAAETPVTTLYQPRPVPISAPIENNALGFDRLQVADTMKGYGRITAIELVEGGYAVEIKDQITKKMVLLSTDSNTRMNTRMFRDLQLGIVVEVFYTGDKAIAFNVLDKESQEGKVYVDGTVEALTDEIVIVDGKEIRLADVTIGVQAKQALKEGSRAQLVFLSYKNDSEYRLKVVPNEEFVVESVGIVKEISSDPLRPTILVETEKGDVLLHVSDDTMMGAAFSDYEVGDYISYLHSAAMTRSLPPQTACYSVSVPKQPR